jgi:hypothetical protein
MRSLMARLGVRGTVALGLGLLVVAVVGIAQVVGDGGPKTGGFASAPRAPSTIEPTAGDDAAVAPTPSATVNDAAIVTASGAFATAWLRRDLSPARWHDDLAPMVTPTLAQSLGSVDPASVPASRVLAAPTVVLRADGYAQTTTTVDTGTLRLGLVERDGRWLVDTVDWERL